MTEGTGQAPDGGWIASELDLLRNNAASLLRVAERLLLAHLEEQAARPQERHLRRVK
jgi:hypothetical protein